MDFITDRNVSLDTVAAELHRITGIALTGSPAEMTLRVAMLARLIDRHLERELADMAEEWAARQAGGL